MKDDIFKKNNIKKFEFNEDVALVFEDMLKRSIPSYEIFLKLSSRLILENTKEEATVYDLGCSLATLLLKTEEKSHKNLNLIGLDNSKPMLEKAKRKVELFNSKISLIHTDILTYNFTACDVFISNFTLQFIQQEKRINFCKKLFSNLKDGGVFIFSEKIIFEDEVLNKNTEQKYYKFKEKNAYSHYEIMKKKEALNNVLTPLSLNENINMIKKAGFKTCEVVFLTFNFALFFARKY